MIEEIAELCHMISCAVVLSAYFFVVESGSVSLPKFHLFSLRDHSSKNRQIQAPFDKS